MSSYNVQYPDSVFRVQCPVIVCSVYSYRVSHVQTPSTMYPDSSYDASKLRLQSVQTPVALDLPGLSRCDLGSSRRDLGVSGCDPVSSRRDLGSFETGPDLGSCGRDFGSSRCDLGSTERNLDRGAR